MLRPRMLQEGLPAEVLTDEEGVSAIQYAFILAVYWWGYTYYLLLYIIIHMYTHVPCVHYMYTIHTNSPVTYFLRQRELVTSHTAPTGHVDRDIENNCQDEKYWVEEVVWLLHLLFWQI